MKLIKLKSGTLLKLPENPVTRERVLNHFALVQKRIKTHAYGYEHLTGNKILLDVKSLEGFKVVEDVNKWESFVYKVMLKCATFVAILFTLITFNPNLYEKWRSTIKN